MKRDKFVQFWNITANEWINNGTVTKHDDENGNHEFRVKELCSFKPDCESNLYNKKSRLFKRREFAETLQKQRDDVANAEVKARTGITLANRVVLGEEVLADLSAFMKEDAAQDNLLAERYADQEKRYEPFRQNSGTLHENEQEAEALETRRLCTGCHCRIRDNLRIDPAGRDAGCERPAG